MLQIVSNQEEARQPQPGGASKRRAKRRPPSADIDRAADVAAKRRVDTAAKAAVTRWQAIGDEAVRLGVLGAVPAVITDSRRRALIALQRRVDELQQKLRSAQLSPDVEMENNAMALATRIHAHLNPDSIAPGRSVQQRHPVAVDLVLRLSDLWSTDIRLVVGSDPSWTSRVDRVLDSKPFCVAWRVVNTLDDAMLARRVGWSLWRPDRELEIKRWRGLTEPDEIAEVGYLIATIRHSDLRGFAKQVVAAAQVERIGADVVRVRSDECSGAEYRRRMVVLGLIERRGHRQSSNDGRPILGHCRNCGQPLTDPISAKRGYGPICRPRDGSRRPKMSPAESASTAFQVAGTPLQQWRNRVLSAAISSTAK